MDSTPRPGARDAWTDGPGRSTRGARPPEHVSAWATAPPTHTAPPRPPGDADTRRATPSRHHQHSSYGADRRRFVPPSPRPTGDACGSLGPLSARPLWRDGPGPSSMLWAGTGGCPPGGGPWRETYPQYMAPWQGS